MSSTDCRASAAVLFTGALAASPASAQITAQEVWEEWQELSAEMGQDLTAESEQMAGGTLTISGLTTTMELPDGSFSGTVERLELTERDDGTVLISMSEDYPMSVTGVSADGETFEMDLLLRQSGLEMTAARNGGETLYDYAVPDITILMDTIDADGESIPVNLEVSMTALEGLYSVAEGSAADRTIRSDLSAGALAMSFDAADPDGEQGDVRLIATVSDLVTTSTGTLSAFAAMSGVSALAGDGVTTEGTATYGASRYEITGEDETGPFALAASAAGGALDFSLDDGLVAYGGSNRDIEVSIAGAQIPFPQLGFMMAESTWEFAGPVGAGETPEDFGMLLRLQGLTIDDMLWSMFDPGGALPRDPATLVIDLAGQGNWLVDLSDPAFDPEELDGDMGEISALTVKELRLDVAGAELTGSGDFTFDNEDTGTFDGMPRPEGSMDFTLVGANGLIETLVTMGLLPQDQAMGARMMLGLFARPGDGPDTLVSRIEVTPEGSVFANGQQLR